MSVSKRTLPSYKLVAAGDMSASITSLATNIQQVDNVGIQLNFTGSPTGTFSVQVSADHTEDVNKNVIVAGHWESLTLSPTPTASGTSGDIYIDLNQLSAPWVRIVYTRSSGTGSLDAYVTGKAI